MKKWLKEEGIGFVDLGNKKLDLKDDYPDFAKNVGQAVVKTGSWGVLVCGSAEGMCIAANKIAGVRAVAPYSKLTARLSREHNDANIVCLSGGGTLKPIGGFSFRKARKITKIFLETEFSGEERHVRRLKKIKKMERLK